MKIFYPVFALAAFAAMAISHSAVADFRQYYHGPTTIVSSGKQPQENTSQKDTHQQFYGPINVVDVRSIPNCVLIREVERRGLIHPMSYFRWYDYWSYDEECF